VQIKRWLVILVTAIVALDVLAAASLLTVQRSMSRIQERYQPVLISAGDIGTLVAESLVSLYRYLGEYLPSTDEALARADALEATLAEALGQEGGDEWRADLEAIRATLDQYRVAVRNLPRIGATTNWREVNELRAQALELGTAMETAAARLKADATAKIREQAGQSLRLSRWAVYLFLGFLVLSLGITVLLALWWRSFEDMILNL